MNLDQLWFYHPETVVGKRGKTIHAANVHRIEIIAGIFGAPPGTTAGANHVFDFLEMGHLIGTKLETIAVYIV